MPDAFDAVMATMPERARRVQAEAARLAKLPSTTPRWHKPRTEDEEYQRDWEEDREGDFR